MNTNTKYLGLELKSPIIAGSCGLTNNIDNLMRLEECGAGAVVLKSVFEEQIIFDIKRNMRQVAPVDQYGMSYEYMASHIADDAMERHFALIREAKNRLSIPVIGSINCYQFQNWLQYAQRFQEAGCDALELNMAILPCETATSADDVRRLYENIINTLKKTISIPISIKVSPYFTDMAKFMEQLSWTGIQGVTMFNKAMNIDIDTDTLQLRSAPTLSAPSDIYNTLRWIGILSRKMRCDLSASTGVFTAQDVVKMLLVGAQSVQVVSALYQQGIDHMRTLNEGLQAWMQEKGFESVDQFRGRLAMQPNDNASMLLRTQFMRYFAEI